MCVYVQAYQYLWANFASTHGSPDPALTKAVGMFRRRLHYFGVNATGGGNVTDMQLTTLLQWHFFGGALSYGNETFVI